MIASIATPTRLAAAPAPAASPAPAPQDTCDIGSSQRLDKLQKRAERLHSAGDMLGMFSMFGMPVYMIPAFIFANTFYPGLGEAGAVLTGLACAGGMVGASLYTTHEGNVVRAQAEALNQQQHCGKQLDWSWAVRH